jgi:hypothetical protein
MLCKEIYKVVIIMRFLLHQSVVPKMFLLNTLLNTRHLLKPWRPAHIMFFHL